MLDSATHRKLALQAAREAIVLLENNDKTLPLPKTEGMSVGLVGPMANNSKVMIGGKADYQSAFITTLLAGVTTKMASFGSESDVGYAQGSAVTKGSDPEAGLLAAAVTLASEVDYTIACVGIDATIEHEGTDRTTIGLPPTQLELLQAVATTVAKVARKKLIVVLVNGGPLSVDWLKEATTASPPLVHAVVEAFDGGQSAGTALADILWGDESPSGSLPFTLYPENFTSQVPLTNMSMRPYLEHPGFNPGRTYRESSHLRIQMTPLPALACPPSAGVCMSL